MPAVEAAEIAVIGERVLRATAGEIRGSHVDRAHEVRGLHAVGRLVDADAKGRGIGAGDRVGHRKLAIGVDGKTVHGQVRCRLRGAVVDQPHGIGEDRGVGVGLQFHGQRAALCRGKHAQIVPEHALGRPWVHGARVGRGQGLVYRADRRLTHRRERPAPVPNDVLRTARCGGLGRPGHIHVIITGGGQIGKRPGGRGGARSVLGMDLLAAVEARAGRASGPAAAGHLEAVIDAAADAIAVIDDFRAVPAVALVDDVLAAADDDRIAAVSAGNGVVAVAAVDPQGQRGGRGDRGRGVDRVVAVLGADVDRGRAGRQRGGIAVEGDRTVADGHRIVGRRAEDVDDGLGLEDPAGEFLRRVDGRAVGIRAVGVAHGDEVVGGGNVDEGRRNRNGMRGLAEVAARNRIRHEQLIGGRPVRGGIDVDVERSCRAVGHRVGHVKVGSVASEVGQADGGRQNVDREWLRGGDA